MYITLQCVHTQINTNNANEKHIHHRLSSTLSTITYTQCKFSNCHQTHIERYFGIQTKKN